jgi:hypothetical protein
VKISNLREKRKQEIILWMSERSKYKIMIWKRIWPEDIKDVEVTMMSDMFAQLVI